MPTEDETTANGLNLPAIGIPTDWASQYRENFKKLQQMLFGGSSDLEVQSVTAEVLESENVEADDLVVFRVGGDVVAGGTIRQFDGGGLEVDSDGRLRVTEPPDGDWDGMSNPATADLDMDGYNVEDAGTVAGGTVRGEDEWEPPVYETLEDAEASADQMRQGGFVWVEEEQRYYYEDGN
ncbi:hypothetical protein GS429_08415 [Natronorubrum sp. JWXQ-INN-674]|uniref:Uncharacterized protein n=1 Tax=Natronorubrum halalkaliphilum TaxID=2691917 RepID=A0A6B0VLK2_9EURY|nr:hypothetical protein [Natronorubrum halalkaliphilum]MXV62083.1 hypothetical protein [Natronorubrum halalkaliphilum]